MQKPEMHTYPNLFFDDKKPESEKNKKNHEVLMNRENRRQHIGTRGFRDSTPIRNRRQMIRHIRRVNY